MADTLHDDQGKPSDDVNRGEDHDSEPKSPPHVTAEEPSTTRRRRTASKPVTIKTLR